METIVTINDNCELVASPYLSKNDELLEEILDPCDSIVDSCYYIEFVISPNLDPNKTVKIFDDSIYSPV